MARKRSKGCKQPRGARVAHRHKSKGRGKKGSKKRGGKCHKTGRKTTNPFLNYLRAFRKKHCDWPVKKVAIEGAKCWCKMTPEQKSKFYKQACKQQHIEEKCRGGSKGTKRYSKSCSRSEIKGLGRSKFGVRKTRGSKRKRRSGLKRKGRSRSINVRSKCGKRGMKSEGRRRGRSKHKRERSSKMRSRSRSKRSRSKRSSSKRSGSRRSRRSGSRRSKRGGSCKPVSGPGIFSTILERGNSVSVVIDPNKGILFKS